MAVKYWYKAGNSNDNWSTTTNWWTTSGGPTTGGVNAGLPTSADDVIFDSLSTTSATVTIVTTAAICNSINFTGFTGTLAGSTVGLNVTNTTGRGLSANTPLFAWGSGMTVSFSGTVTFGGTGTGGWIYSNGKTFQGPITFTNLSATFTFKDIFRTSSAGTGALVTLAAGFIVATDALVEFGRFTSTTTNIKTFTCSNLYLTGTGALYTLGLNSTNLTSTITNLIVSNATTTPKTLLFNTQFGSTNLELGGSGNISIALGATKQPAVTVTNTGGTASVFNITASTTIKSLVFTQPITWSNTAAITTTIAGNLTLVSGVTIGALGTPNLVFSANATITTAGKSLVTGTLTINASITTTIIGALSSDANITFNTGSTVNTSDNFSTTGTLTIGGTGNLSGSIISAGILTLSGATASLNTVSNSAVTCTGLTTLTGGGAIAYAGTFTSGSITITSGSFTGTTGVAGNLVCTGILTITLGSINTGGASLYASSITQTGTGVKSIAVTGVGSGLYLTGNFALYENGTGSTNLTTDITNIYVTNTSTSGKSLIFNNQFGSANLELGGSGTIIFNPGTTKIPNVTVTNTGGIASGFSIDNGTIRNLIFTTPVTWDNNPGITLTLVGDTFTLVSGMVFSARGHCSLVFSNNVEITLAGKSLVTGTLTTNANATFDGGITSNAAVTLNGVTSIPGNIVTTAALAIGGACTITGDTVSSSTLAINGATASIIQSTGSLFNVSCSGVFSITQGSLNTNGGTLTVSSITSSGANAKSITVPNVYLTGTGTLYAGATGLTTSIINIYINNASTTAKSLIFDTQFGSTNVELGGSGNITFTPGTTKIPNVTVTNTGGTSSVFNIAATGTIGKLIFTTPVTWNNTLSVTLTLTRDTFTLVSGMVFGANGHSSLVFSNNVEITLAGKSLVTGTLTTNANATFDGGITSNAAISLNGVTSIPGNIITTAALTIGGDCTIAGDTVSSSTLTINGATALLSGPGIFNVSCSGAFTITQGSLNTNGGTLTVASITINSSSTSNTVGSVLCNGLTTISNGGGLTYSGTFTSSSVTINSGTIQNDGSINNQTFTCANILTLVSGAILVENSISEMYVGSISISGSGFKTISTPSLYLTGTGTLFTPGAATGLSTGIQNIYVTNNSITSRTLTFTDTFGSTNVYLQGTLSGAITFGGGTVFVPNVYVQNTGGAVISFQTGTFTSLTFSTGTNVIWTNAASQTITMQGNLVMVSTMNTLTTTPTLLFNAAASITLDGETLYTGSIIVDGIQVDILDNFNSNIPVIVQNGGTLNTKGFLTTGLLSILGTSTISTTGSAFSIGSLTLLDGTVNLGSNSHICTGNVGASGSSYINNSALTINGTLTISGGGQLDLNSSVNIIGLTTLTGGSTLNINSYNTVFSAVTITNGYINASGASYVCTGVTTLTEGDFGNSGDYYTGTLTIGGASATKNIYATNLYFTGTGTLYTQGLSVILSTGPEAIHIIESTSAAKTLTCGTQFPLTPNIPIFLGGSGSGAISITPAAVCLPVINVTNTGGANISIGGTSATITTLDFANNSNAIWNNGSMTLNIQGNLLLNNNPSMTIANSPTIVFNVGPSTIALFGKSLTAPISITSTAFVDVSSDFSSTSTVTVTDGAFYIYSSNFNATTLTIAVNGTVQAANNTVINLSSLSNTGAYTQLYGSLTCSGAITISGTFNLGTNAVIPIPVIVTCQSVVGSTVNCSISVGSGITIILTGTGTVWSVPATAASVGVGGTIKIIDNSTTNITFAGGSWGYHELIFDRGTSPNNNIISGSNTFTNLRDWGTAAHFLILTTGTTQAVGHFDVKGSPGNSIAIARSGTTGVATLSRILAGLVLCDWITVTNVNAQDHTGNIASGIWYTGPQGSLVSGTGWNTGGKVRNQSALGAG